MNFDQYIDGLVIDDADLRELRSAPVKNAPTKTFKKKAPAMTSLPRVTARQALLNRMHAFEEQYPGLGTFLKESASWSDFAGSLYEHLITKGSLSEKQIAAAQSMRAKVGAPKAAPATVEVDLGSIRETFDRAIAKGLKRPTYRAEGLVISKAPDHGKNAGALYVKRDDEYQGKLVGKAFLAARSAAAETPEALKRIAGNPEAAAIRYGRETGVCSCCGRKLTVALSIERGIGPVCFERYFT